MVQVNWTIQAKNDLRSIFDYISKDSRKYAQLQILRLAARTHILKNQIYSGKVVQELGKQNIRELIEGNYRIIYKIVKENQVDILTVHHSSRDLSRRKV